jgi:hypothetical protein
MKYLCSPTFIQVMEKKAQKNRLPTFKDLPSPVIATNAGTAKGSDVDESGF